MSWKSLVSAGLLCVLASPAFAVGPQLEIRSGGLNANGDWIWNVRIAPSAAGTPLDAELALTKVLGGNIVSVTNADPAKWDYNNPGNAPASHVWVKTYGTPLKPEGLQGNFEGAAAGSTVVNTASLGGTTAATGCEGATANCAGVPADAGQNQIFAALGSKDLLAGDLAVPAAGPALFGNANASGIIASTAYLQVITDGPTDASLTSSIQLSGAYDGGNNSGRIAETTGTNTSSNYKGYVGTASITVRTGDINLDGIVNSNDASLLGANFTLSGKNWTTGDLNGDGTVNSNDASLLGANFTLTGGSHTPLVITNAAVDGAGSGSGLGGGSVPEPASIALLGLAVLGGLGLYGRKR